MLKISKEMQGKDKISKLKVQAPERRQRCSGV